MFTAEKEMAVVTPIVLDGATGSPCPPRAAANGAVGGRAIKPRTSRGTAIVLLAALSILAAPGTASAAYGGHIQTGCEWNGCKMH